MMQSESLQPKAVAAPKSINSKTNTSKVIEEQKREYDMEENFGTLSGQQMPKFDAEMKPGEYVNRVIRHVEALFKQDRGRKEAKKANLGDIRSTKIRTPEILRDAVYDCSNQSQEYKASTYVSGNIKAIVPLFREKLSSDDPGFNLTKFKRGQVLPIKEKRIFGILTAN